ncbi:MAG TPA: ABC transporter permease [Candidatus Acidoferrales bacterium]|nr:ABC transporter permease [Candidatus Acidoferrales bacterium]
MTGWIRILAARLRALVSRRKGDVEFKQEIEAHLEMLAAENRARGMTEEEARRMARLRLGGTAQLQETNREQWALPLAETTMQDARYALRMLRKNPGFTAVAVLSLALGIGANALVFSVVNAILLRPLPVEHPERLVFLENKNGNPGQSYPNYRDFRDRNESFAGLAGYRVAPMELETGNGATRIWGYLATGNYFDTIGVAPLVGRFFHQEDDLHPGASPYVVLSYAFWQGKFGGDPEIAGKTIRINRIPYTVVGVAGRNFHGTETFFWPDVWVPMMMEAQIEIGNPWLETRATFNTWVIGRLKPGVTPPQATADLNRIADALTRQFPTENEGLQLKLAKPGLVGDALGAPVRAFAAGVALLAGLVLLAACANLASLLTARFSDRQKEIAIRVSIGASRSRVMRQVLTESLVLSALGGTAGFGLAAFLSNILSSWHAPLDFPVQFNVRPDWRVFFFAFGISIFAGMIFGLGAAWRASQTDANSTLKGGETGWRGSRIAFRDALMVAQVAVCFVLVAGCALSIQGLKEMVHMKLGFEPQGVTMVAFDLGLAGHTDADGRNFQRRALTTVENLPGVQSAAYSNSVPLSIDQSHTWIFTEGQEGARPVDAGNAVVYEVSPGFFRTIGTRMLVGRDFTWEDGEKSSPVAIVNAEFGKQILHSDEPLGKRFRQGPKGKLIEIVGVVETGKYESPTEAAEPALFFPEQQRYNTTTTLLVRSSLPSAPMTKAMQSAVARLDPELSLYGSGSMEQMLGFAFFPSRAAAVALSAFGVLAIMLAATSIYGLVSYGVARRVREIGIRVAVGALPHQVLRLVLGRTLGLLLAGCVAGSVLALAAGKLLASVVYGASPRDLGLLAFVWAATIVIGILSSWAPTWRALRIDPMTALRTE